MNNDELQEHFATQAFKQGLRSETHSPRAIKIRSMFKRYLPGGTILDVGCADGALLAPISKQYRIIGVDVSTPMMELALKNGYSEIITASLEAGLPFGNDAFDGVFCGETLEHVVDTDFALCELNRVLKPGGVLVVTVPNVRTIFSLIRWFLNDPPMFGARYRSGHVRDFTTKHIRVALRNNGFETVKLVGSDFYPISMLNGLATFLPSFATTVIAVAHQKQKMDYQKRDNTSIE